MRDVFDDGELMTNLKSDNNEGLSMRKNASGNNLSESGGKLAGKEYSCALCGAVTEKKQQLCVSEKRRDESLLRGGKKSTR
jgi:hypothetical protein